jgi:hypothetical protein
MVERKPFAKTPREHFMRAAEDELNKFVRRELAFQRAERQERAQRLRLPVGRVDRIDRSSDARNIDFPRSK